MLLDSIQLTVTDTVFMLAAGELLVMDIARVKVVPPMVTVSLGKLVVVAYEYPPLLMDSNFVWPAAVADVTFLLKWLPRMTPVVSPAVPNSPIVKMTIATSTSSNVKPS